MEMSNEVTVKQETQSRDENLRPGRTFAPNVEIRETNEALWIWADLPGVDQDAVNVNLENNVLRIDGAVSPGDYADLAPVYTEYNVGGFERTFRLTTPIDADNIHAKMNNGVLELQLPKAEEARPRQIPISLH
jgi:HSP20 family molecular chaperone IbpA